ncbi:MAG TPA: folylpolyglutamate synthase/dihydrofolate synthase family protein [Thermosynechococcaceae cyanobacterium]
MNIDALLEKFAWTSAKLGLESSWQLLDKLGNPQLQVPIVHVAGTNGKGSVCAYLSSVLTAADYRVGRYTSPHLVDWNERICLNEQPIAPDDLERVLMQVVAAAQSDPQLEVSQFEIVTAAAWLYFAQQQVDIAVMEVGLGGRLDSTNVVDRPLVSIITSISYDHTHILGSTLAAIAGEKAGILKPGCPAVIGPVPPEAGTVIDQRLAELGCSATYPIAATCQEACQETWAEAQGIRYPLPLAGAVQLQNSAIAIAALQSLRQQGWQISDAAVAVGMGKTSWPGRMQWFSWRSRTILIDGAHNPAGAIALRQFVDTQPNSFPVHWIVGMMTRKDHAESLKALLRSGDQLYLVPVPDPKTADPEALATLARQVCPKLDHCQAYPSEFAALEAALEAALDKNHGLTVLCGSLYLLGHFLAQARSLQG